jgi:hypothetical protein
MLMKNYSAGEMPGVYCSGGIYETDLFHGAITAGELLKVSPTGLLSAGPLLDNEKAVALALLVDAGILKFKLLV